MTSTLELLVFQPDMWSPEEVLGYEDGRAGNPCKVTSSTPYIRGYANGASESGLIKLRGDELK